MPTRRRGCHYGVSSYGELARRNPPFLIQYADAAREIVTAQYASLLRPTVVGWCRKRDSNPRPHHYE
jgi:hypothetical protein